VREIERRARGKLAAAAASGETDRAAAGADGDESRRTS
jgi:hypothetical protein